MTVAPTHIHLCGRLRVTLDGEPREGELRGRQGRAVFAYLAWHRLRPVRRDELVDALWTENGRAPGPAALAPVLSRLRTALAPGTVAGRDQLTLELPGPVWVDVEVARLALARARARDAPSGDALIAAQEAEAMVRDGLLPGLEAPWLEAPRAAVADLHVEALEHVARTGARLDPQAAEEAARAAVAAAPFRESARGALIEVLRARGNVAEAVRAYEELRLLLRDELGTVPGPELVALHEGLLGIGDAPAPRPATVPSPPAADLVEREAEVAEIEAALSRLAAGQGGALVFEGPAGIGKTRLLAELRRRALTGGARVLDAADSSVMWRTARAEVALAMGEPRLALSLTKELEHLRPAGTHPLWSPWRGLRAQALMALGEGDAALALAAEELALAERTGAPWVVGRGLRLLGELEGADGIPRLRQAVRLLDGTSAGLERDRARAALCGG